MKVILAESLGNFASAQEVKWVLVPTATESVQMSSFEKSHGLMYHSAFSLRATASTDITMPPGIAISPTKDRASRTGHVYTSRPCSRGAYHQRLSNTWTSLCTVFCVYTASRGRPLRVLQADEPDNAPRSTSCKVSCISKANDCRYRVRSARAIVCQWY